MMPANVASAQTRRFAIVTEDRYRALDADNWYHAQIAREEGLLQTALEARGVVVKRCSWSDPAVDWTSFDAAVVRSTWDYFERHDEFTAWLERASAATRLINDARLMRWNADKRYLGELAAAGIAVVPTRFVARGEAVSLAEIQAECGWEEMVFKPVVSGAGRLTYRVGADVPAADEITFAACVAAENMMVQRFEPSIMAAGEVSVIVIDGVATHAIRKTAKTGEFRVQDDHGGTVHPHPPSEQERAFAQAAVAACPWSPLYARVDFVAPHADQLLLMELELIEPELFFRFHPAAADALAAATVADQASH